MTPSLAYLTQVRKLILLSSLLLASVIFLGYDFMPNLLSENLKYWLWKINSFAIFLVMLIRPLSDLLPTQKWLRTFIPMRKELGILSAMIVLSFGLAKYIMWGPSEFFQTYFSLDYWPFPEPIFWGRLGELVAIPLLLTSNFWSMKRLKKNWKRIQRLAYVYFFAGAYYVYAAFGAIEELWFMAIIMILTLGAFLKRG